MLGLAAAALCLQDRAAQTLPFSKQITHENDMFFWSRWKLARNPLLRPVRFFTFSGGIVSRDRAERIVGRMVLLVGRFRRRPMCRGDFLSFSGGIRHDAWKTCQLKGKNFFLLACAEDST